MQYGLYLINKMILALSVFLVTLFIKDNILTVNNAKKIYMKDGFPVFEDSYKYLLTSDNKWYFIVLSIILLFFYGIILYDKNVKVLNKIEKLVISGIIYVVLFFDLIKKNYYQFLSWDLSKSIIEMENEHKFLILYSISICLVFFLTRKNEKNSEENTIFPSREQLGRSLEYYLNAGVKSILIDGEWGSGKTYFIENFLKKSTNEYSPIWVKASLFNNKKEIKKFIFEELKVILEDNCISINPIDDLMKKFELIGNNTFINFSKANSSFDNDIQLVKKYIEKINKKVILVIDDLERVTNGNLVKEYISIISEIEDSLNLRVFILMDFSKIEREENRVYINKYYERHLKIPKLEHSEAINTFFDNDILKKCIQDYINLLESNNNGNNKKSTFLDFLKNPRYVSRSVNELNEIVKRINPKSNLTKSNISFKKKVHLIYSVISFQLLRSVYPEKKIDQLGKEEFLNFEFVFTELYNTFNNSNSFDSYDFNKTLKIIKILDKYNGVIIPEMKDKSLDDYVELGYVEEAITILQEQPKSYFVFFKLGELFYELKKYKYSIEAYTNALKYKEELEEKVDISNLYNNRAMIYEELKEIVYAEEDYNRAIEIESNDSMIFNNRGEFYLTLKRYDEAEIDLKKSIKINGKNILACYNLGILYDIQKNYEKAIFYFSKAKNISSNDPRVENLDVIISILKHLKIWKEKGSSIHDYVTSVIEKAELFMISGDLKTALLNLELLKKESDEVIDSDIKLTYLDMINNRINDIKDFMTNQNNKE